MKKTILTKTFLSFAILSLIGVSQANATVKVSCTDIHSEGHFSILIPMNKTTGKALVLLSNGQKFKGKFNSKVIGGMTRLTGATALDVAAFYDLPDYGKPHKISVSVVGYYGQLSGHAELTSLTGQPLDQIFISCKTELIQNNAATISEVLVSPQCKVSPQNDCSNSPKRLCCDCSSGALSCY